MKVMIMSDEKSGIPEYQDDDLLSVNDIAKLIDRTNQRVRQLIKELGIPHQVLGGAMILKYKDLGPIFERNTIPGYTPPEDE